MVSGERSGMDLSSRRWERAERECTLGVPQASQLGTGSSEVLQVASKIKCNGPRSLAAGTPRSAMTAELSSIGNGIGNGDRVRGNNRVWRLAGLRLLAVSVAGLMLSGCGMSTLTSGVSGGVFGGGSSTGTTASVTEQGLLSSAKAEGTGDGGSAAGGCPRIQVTSRDNYITIYEPGRAGDSLGVMHRGEITRTARECTVEGGRVTVKYGFSGRVLLGPRGRPGLIQLPVTVAVRDAKRAPIAGDRTRIEASVTIDSPIGYFSQVRTVTFDVPVGARPADVDVFVGFEQTAPGAG